MKKVIILAVLFPLWGLGGLYAQLTTNEQPYGLQQRSAGQSKQKQIVLPPPDVRQLAIEDSINESSRFAVMDSVKQGGGSRFAYPVWVNYTPYNSGVWEQLPNGDKIWRLKIKIPDALSTHTYYERFWLPDGCKFFVYSEETEQSIGAVTSEFIKGSKNAPIKYATALIYGESVVYEYYQPASVTDTADIVINRIGYGYRNVKNPYQKGSKGIGDSDPCNEDICLTNDFQNERNAVTRITVQTNYGDYWFTGYLINNTKNDNTPYVLTTLHTITMPSWYDAATPDQWWFYWGFTDCSNINYYTTGATVVASSGLNQSNAYETSFVLLELDDDPRKNNVGFTPYYLGWDITNSVVTQTGACIHHPNGDYQKYGRFNSRQTYSGYNMAFGLNAPSAGEAWDINFNFGFVAGAGSTGAPVLDANNRVIGTYVTYNIYSQCGSFRGFTDKFSHSWTGGGAANPANRLDSWLDPCNTGATILDGIGDVGGIGNIWQLTPVQGTVSTTTWSTPMEVTGNINIPNGVTLTITSVVKCQPNVNITVQPGGKLVVDGGTLTSLNICGLGDMWQGVVIMGIYNPSSTPFLQGIVELVNGAKIENAVCGISVKQSIDGAGIIYADNAHFINNKQAVCFAPYSLGFLGIPGNSISINNARFFKNCEFKLNNSALFPQAGIAQVELQEANGIQFTNCTFEDNRTKKYLDDYTNGIYANASSVQIGSISPWIYPWGGMPYAIPMNDGCKFSEFDKGIYIKNRGSSPSSIYSSEFENNYIGIVLEGVANANIVFNQFKMLSPITTSQHIISSSLKAE